jgi:hypothetical protein
MSGVPFEPGFSTPEGFPPEMALWARDTVMDGRA